ncbi:MAG: M28 family peptidase, partial [Candidatus Hadarchaeales archaeon]
MEFELKNAFEHIDKLAYEIGPRIAGTRGEQMAAEYIAGRFREFGLEVDVQRFRFKRRSTVVRVSRLIFLSSFLATLILGPFQSMIVWAAALALGFSVKWLLPSSESRNVIARKIVREPKMRLAISAHYDTAPCIRWRPIFLYGRFAVRPLLAVITLLLLTRLFVGLPWEVAWASCGLFFIPACLSPLLAVRREGSPGADDNASGVAVMLECARVLADEKQL